MKRDVPTKRILIACGGTGGHLFPGVAIAEALLQRGIEVALVISTKDVDQEAARGLTGMEILSLTGAPMVKGRVGEFVRGFNRSFWESWEWISDRRPAAVISMGGFSSAPVALAARIRGIPLFLHEANAVPGRANRLLAPMASIVFAGFEGASNQLCNQRVEWTGTPARAQFQPADGAAQRMALGFSGDRPLLLIMGGSQGAAGINELMFQAAPLFRSAPDWQFLHLTGADQCEKARSIYARAGLKAVTKPFLTEMELALGAATVVIGRAGASSLAEIAAMRVPSILVPYPHAVEDHQRLNARIFESAGAAWLLEQREATPEILFNKVQVLGSDARVRERMGAALGRLGAEDAADRIANRVEAECDKGFANRAGTISGSLDEGAARRAKLLMSAKEELISGRTHRLESLAG